MVSNRRYPNPFQVYKTTVTGSSLTGGGIVTKEVVLEGFCSLQKGNIKNENKAVTYKWMICFNLNDKKSIPIRPATLLLDNSHIVKVTDWLGNAHEYTLSEQFHSDLGSDIYFGEVNANGQ